MTELSRFEKQMFDLLADGQGQQVLSHATMIALNSGEEEAWMQLVELAQDAADLQRASDFIDERIGYGNPPEKAPIADFNCLELRIRSMQRTTMGDVIASHLDPSGTLTRVDRLLEESFLSYDPAEKKQELYKKAEAFSTDSMTQLRGGPAPTTPAELYRVVHLAVFWQLLEGIASRLTQSQRFLGYAQARPFTFLGTWANSVGGTSQQRARRTLRTL